ncbi:recombinase family protein [Streptomyces sp. NPDC004561]
MTGHPVGGPIDPDNEAHDLVMSVFGGMSKGERNRIKIRVRTAMGSQAQLQGRYLGGRPPYGYRIADAGPHPNPSKAAAGQRIHKLEPDPAAAPVVERIFRLYVDGMSYSAIAAQLTREGIPAPPPTTPPAIRTARRPHGNRAPCAPSSSTPATPATRSGASSARKNASSTSTTSPSATAPT